MPNKEDGDYPVGFKKTPQHTRFQPGQSGNPKGRPREAKNMATLLDEALNELVVVRENGRKRRITKRKASMKQLANKAAAGEIKFLQLLLATIRDSEATTGAHETDGVVFDEADQQVIQNIIRRLNGTEDDDGHEQK